MPGHTYTGLKRYADAAYQQEGSARVDHAYMIRDRVMPFEIHNYAHNNQWLVTSLSHVGRVRDAIAVARNLVEQPRDPNKNGKNDGGSPQRSGRLRWSEVLARYELWDDLIAATTSGALDWSDVPPRRKQKAYTLGLAYAAKGDQARLAEQVAALKALQAEDAKAKRDAGTAAALAELEGYQTPGKGDVGPAFEQFAKATAMRPEALARAHLTARNFGFAESTAKRGRRQAAEPGPAARRPGRDPPRRRQDEGGAGGLPQARAAGPVGRPRHAVFRRLAPIVAAWKADEGLGRPRRSRATDDATADRIDLTTLGPLAWSPFPAEPFAGDDTDGKPWRSPTTRERTSSSSSSSAASAPTACSSSRPSARSRGLQGARTPTSSPSAPTTSTATQALKDNADGIKFPMPMLADPGSTSSRLPRLRRLRGPAAPRHVPDRRRRATSASSGSRPSRSSTSTSSRPRPPGSTGCSSRGRAPRRPGTP